MADDDLNEEDLDIEIDDEEEEASSNGQERSHGDPSAKDDSVQQVLMETRIDSGPLAEDSGTADPPDANENNEAAELNEDDLDIELEDDDMVDAANAASPGPPSIPTKPQIEDDGPKGEEMSPKQNDHAMDVDRARGTDESASRKALADVAMAKTQKGSSETQASDSRELQDAGTKRSAADKQDRNIKRKLDWAGGSKRSQDEGGRRSTETKAASETPHKAAAPRKKDTRFLWPPPKKTKVYQPPTDPSAPVKNLYKINLDELTPAELMNLMTFPKPERGLGSSKKLLVQLNHRRTNEEPFRGDLVAYLSGQMETMFGSPHLWQSDRFSGLVTLISNLTEVMLHGEESHAEPLSRIMYKQGKLLDQIQQVVEDYFFDHIKEEVPELAAADADDSDAEERAEELENNTSRMAGTVWRMLCAVLSLLQLEEARPDLGGRFTRRLLGSANFHAWFLRTLDVLDMPLMKGRWGKAQAGDKAPSSRTRGQGLLFAKLSELWGVLLYAVDADQLTAMRKGIIKHKDFETVLKLLFMKLKGRDKAAMMSLKLLNSLSHSKKFINTMGESLDLETLREQFATLALEAAARLAGSDDDGAWVEILEVLNMLLGHDAARECVLMSEDRRELVVAVCGQLFKNLDKMCASAVECRAATDDPEVKAVGRRLSTKIQYFFRLLARLALNDPMPIAALLWQKFGGSEVKDERLVVQLNKIADFELLGLTSGDEGDKQNYKAIAEMVGPTCREKLLAYISGAQTAGSAKDMKETLDKLQDTEVRMADAAVSFGGESYEKGMQMIQNGVCVEVVGEDRKRFGGDKWDQHLRWMRRTGGGIDPVPFVMLRRNVYLHRKYVKLSVDAVPVCRCHMRAGKSKDGRAAQGCREETCVLRQTFTECTPGFCPCGDTCTNQRFQKQQYAAVECKRTPDKRGWGLFAREAISKGEFVIEYMGEVVNKKGYEKRKKEYAKEFNTYFMQLSTQPFEMIDASRKSSLGRFLNHSCDPNCETQRWRSLGEPVVGIFAKRDLKAGEEIVFDYQMDDGAEQRKCRCKAPNCRGMLGKKEGDDSDS